MNNWKHNIDQRQVLDNGSFKVRYGNHLQKQTCINLVAQLKKTGQSIYEFSEFFDESEVQQYYKPHTRGVLVDFDKQINIWDRIISKGLKEQSITYPYQPFTPDIVIQKLFEVMFEYYGVDAVSPVCAQKMLYYLTPKKMFTYIIDSSHSATYFVPIFDDEIIWNSVLRLDVGGRLLTNQLKELISFNQFDLKKHFLLSTKIKEALCYISENFKKEMKLPKKSLQKYYVLPDFDIKRPGYATKQLNVGFLDAKINLDKERISIPEILFTPSEIGLNQKGIIECVIQSLNSIHSDLRGYFTENIYLAGGNTKFENLQERFSNGLRSGCPEEWDININKLNDDDATFEGCILYNQSDQFSAFSKLEYQEKGYENIKQYIQ